MKMKYWALSLLACGGMLACTNDEVAENNGKEGGTEVSYLAVNVLTASGPGSRDLPEGYELGSKEENEISTMRFYLFNSDGTPYTLIGGTNCVVPTDKYAPTDDDKTDETVEEVGNAVLVINNASTATPPASVVAILNYAPGSDGKDDFAGKNLTQLKAVVGNYGAAGSGNFIMSNSVYNDATTIGEVSIDGKLTNDETEAKKNPVDIYVERVVAKVSVTFSGAEKTGNQYLVYGTDGGTDAIYAKVMGWQVADYKDQSYILKNIDKDWTETDLGINPWSAANYHRSFWATSATGSVVNDKSWSEITNFADVYTQENTPSDVLESADNNDLTKVIVAVQLVDNNGDPEPRYQYLGLPYGSEADILTLVAEKFPNYYIKTADDAYKQITAAELKFVKGSTVEGASYRVYAQLADEFTAAMDGEKNNLYTKSSESSYQQVDEAGLTTLKADLKKYYAQVWKDGMAYYYTTIKHLGTSGKVGEYGVVRNHVYKVAITDIKGFGTPVYDPDEDIDPVKPADDASYLAAKINILSWRIVNSSVTLE